MARLRTPALFGLQDDKEGRCRSKRSVYDPIMHAISAPTVFIIIFFIFFNIHCLLAGAPKLVHKAEWMARKFPVGEGLDTADTLCYCSLQEQGHDCAPGSPRLILWGRGYQAGPHGPS